MISEHVSVATHQVKFYCCVLHTLVKHVQTIYGAVARFQHHTTPFFCTGAAALLLAQTAWPYFVSSYDKRPLSHLTMEPSTSSGRRSVNWCSLNPESVVQWVSVPLLGCDGGVAKCQSGC